MHIWLLLGLIMTRLTVYWPYEKTWITSGVWKTLNIHVTLQELKSLQTALWVPTNIDGNSEFFWKYCELNAITWGKISWEFGCELDKMRQACGIHYQRHSKWEKTSTAGKGHRTVCNKVFICQLTLEGSTFLLSIPMVAREKQKNKRSEQLCSIVFMTFFVDPFVFLTLLFFYCDTKYLFKWVVTKLYVNNLSSLNIVDEFLDIQKGHLSPWCFLVLREWFLLGRLG